MLTFKRENLYRATQWLPVDATYYDKVASLQDTHWWFVARRRILRSVLDCLHLPSDSTVLEAGCGTGGNLSLLAEYGSLFAFEPDLKARKRARARGIGQVMPGSLPDEVPLQKESFDLVALLDVLEHISDDRAVLETLRRMLKPGGTLLVTVPAYQFLWSRHDIVNHHKRRYRRSVLTQLVEAAGFAVTYKTYFNTILFPVAAVIRGWNRVTGSTQESGPRRRSTLQNTLLAEVFACERWVVPHLRLPFGVSILLTAKKSSR